MRPFSHYLECVKTERVEVDFNLAGTTPAPPKKLRPMSFMTKEAPQTDVYASVLGSLEKMLKARKGEVTLLPGCSQALQVTLAAITSPGDVILIETPTYEPFLATAQFLGLRIRRFKRTGLREKDLQQIRRKSVGAKVILLANPSCPSGHLLSRADLYQLSKLGPTLVVDEIYLPLFDKGTLTRLSHPKSIHISGLSKTVGLSSARVGWARANKTTIEKINRIATLYHVDMPTPSLQVANQALSNWKKLLLPSFQNILLNSEVARNLPLTASLQGSFASLRVPKKFSSGHQFAEALRKKSVWVRAGEWFENPRTVRINLLTEPSKFKKACAIILDLYA